MKQHVVTIIQGDGEVSTIPLNTISGYEANEYISKALEDLWGTLRWGTSFKLPLTIHYTEVD